MSESLQVLIQLLGERCKQLSKHGPKTLDMTGLVAWRDDLVMTANNFSDAGEIFNAAHEAFLARFRFARLNFEKSRGPSELYAEEYICGPETDDQHQCTGNIILRAQYVLKTLTKKPD